MRYPVFGALLAIVMMTSAPAFAHDGGLPLGDGKFSTSPQRGYIYSCQTQFRGGGAFADGPWIAGDTWYPDRKINVQGDVAWPNASADFGAEKGGIRLIRTNGLPDHNTGQFPISRSDPAYRYDRNPNSIAEHQIQLQLPLTPAAAAQPSCVGMGMIGVSLTGVAIFNGFDDGGRDAVAHEVQDKCDGHPQQQGQYHYHGYSPCMKEEGRGADGSSGLVGYALDGFGIYGPYGAGGREMTDADLDACHGTTGPVMWDGKVQNIYHYVMTFEYPYSIGCFMGEPVLKQNRMGGGPPPMMEGGRGMMTGQQGDGMGGGGPPPDGRRIMQQAAQTLGVDPQRLMQAVGPPPPDFGRASQALGIPEEQIRAAFDQARGGR